MTNTSPPTSTVDDLKKQLEPILAKIRALRAEIETLENKNRQRYIAAQSLVVNGKPNARGSEAMEAVSDHHHAVSRLKLRIQYLGKFEEKLNRQISVLMGKKFPEVDEDGSGEEKDAVAGRKAPLSERQIMKAGGSGEQVKLEPVSKSEGKPMDLTENGLAKLSLSQ